MAWKAWRPFAARRTRRGELERAGGPAYTLLRRGRDGAGISLNQMDPGIYFLWVEQSGLSRWIRESPSLLAFPGILFLHTLGMGFLAGTNMALDLRILGVAPRIPLAPLERFFRVMWSAFCLSAVSGVLLWIAYPVKASTNPLFYVKLALVALAVSNIRMLRKQVFRGPRPAEGPVLRKSKILAGTSLFLWVAVITTGRLLAYTYSQMYWNG